ncbi:Uncharacterized protein Fot_17164 [Forsythia ovata]|uniref:Uncharacterized protein n=1 Tax=Forsythia ovata TaxID=205694 RepID=A0ABD1VGN2_9LAMI
MCTSSFSGSGANEWSRAQGVVLKTLGIIGSALWLKRMTKSTTRWDHTCIITQSLNVFQMPICAISDGTWVHRIGEPNVWPLTVLRPSALRSVQAFDSDITSSANDKSNAHTNLEKMTIHQAHLKLAAAKAVIRL